MNNYTRGELRVVPKQLDECANIQRGDLIIAKTLDEREGNPNAHRLASCWNACERADITNPDAIPEVIAAAQFWADQNAPGINEGPCFAAKEALRKLKESR